MVSVIIPSCKEKYLQKTIDSINERASGNIEIVVGLDGYAIEDGLRSDVPLTMVQSNERVGMRPIIRECASRSRGDYLLKCDAHCHFDYGFDTILASSCEDNWICVPRQYQLDERSWDKSERRPYVDHWYFTAPYYDEKVGCNVGMKGVRWHDRAGTRGRDVEGLMTFQGSCWLMPKAHFMSIGMDDEGFGTFAYEAAEIGMKTWMSGGRVVINKGTWFAHLTKSRSDGRGYFLKKGTIRRSGAHFIDMCMNNKWPNAKYTMKEFIEKFSPVPTWDNFDWSAKW